MKIILRIWGKSEAWSSEELEYSRPKKDLLREVVDMVFESPRFPVYLWGSEGDLLVSASVVDLEVLVGESEGRQSPLPMGEKLAFAEVEGYSFPLGSFLDTVELDLEILAIEGAEGLLAISQHSLMKSKSWSARGMSLMYD